MYLSKRVIVQMAIFTTGTIVATSVMAFHYMGLPNLLFGVGHYRVTLNLPTTGGLYPSSNVTYRGTEVGRVQSIALTGTGVEATLSLKSGVDIPADLDAEVHSQSAIGEQFVALRPRSSDGPLLKNGDVIPADRTSVPPDINSLLDATNRGIEAIPHDNLKTVIDEGYTAVGGLGPELSRLVKGTTTLAIDARENLDALIALTDRSQPVLDTQTNTSDSIATWAANIATVTKGLKAQDPAVSELLNDGQGAVDAARELLDRFQPSLPVLLNNLVSLNDVALSYRADLEQLLVLLPQGISILQGAGLANRDTKQPYKGAFLSFNLNLNLPPACLTGFLPAQQQRVPTDVDYPARPDGNLYCRVPQDSPFNVRGARNIPCETKPGKRAPTAAMCESDENYVPLNDGYNWKGDPNATLSGQPIPQSYGSATDPNAPPQATPQQPIAIAEYDPGTGSYIGPDGRRYTQTDLGTNMNKRQSWQDMVVPPKGQ
ncbi:MULTISPECIES: MCE family protein [Mycolicibacterium]|uniref:MCE family protein n=1 Tax=Mycolicibacterium TaxID=1866885 RepID=UPI0007EC7977|nr:MlaD family protein [Mycolicibacterium fortuitum]NOP99235.1 MCE family protein [Mycolicibacterium fortuitum]OBJ95180.1 mammalian cell entry protein [Mycolicibacterium fortuitum]